MNSGPLLHRYNLLVCYRMNNILSIELCNPRALSSRDIKPFAKMYSGVGVFMNSTPYFTSIS